MTGHLGYDPIKSRNDLGVSLFWRRVDFDFDFKIQYMPKMSQKGKSGLQIKIHFSWTIVSNWAN